MVRKSTGGACPFRLFPSPSVIQWPKLLSQVDVEPRLVRLVPRYSDFDKLHSALMGVILFIS
jgi:hypothetical protein